jgi:hypothetical protein
MAGEVIVCEELPSEYKGIVPSEKEHKILLRLLRDVIGFTSIVDHLQTTELILERNERSTGRVDYSLSVYVYDITDDVFE